MSERPSFIRSTTDVPECTHVYPQSKEPMGPMRSLGKAAGLERIGINIQGEVDAWIDGHVHRMKRGDLAAFPAGTGISHCFINNSDHEVLLLVGGEAAKKGSRIFYPLNPSRRSDMAPSNWWDDVPRRELGPHDGLPT